MVFFARSPGDPENRMSQRKLTFGLLDSRMFNEFDGEWRMQFNSRKVSVQVRCERTSGGAFKWPYMQLSHVEVLYA